MSLISVLKEKFPNISFIAEDLGYPSPEVVKMLDDSSFPGMKVLEFAFDDESNDINLPHVYHQNTVCYTGTHDNDTLKGWLDGLEPEKLKRAVDYFGLNGDEGYLFGIIRGGMSSVSRLFVAQLQDYLGLPNEARINTPGTKEGNWRFRITKGQIPENLSEKIAHITKIYNR